jgi:hypothetical protein
MVDDPRCCGTGTCLIDAEGRCWCGQQWDGQKMCFAEPGVVNEPVAATSQAPADQTSSPKPLVP